MKGRTEFPGGKTRNGEAGRTKSFVGWSKRMPMNGNWKFMKKMKGTETKLRKYVKKTYMPLLQKDT
jgi:hypothetical protein